MAIEAKIRGSTFKNTGACPRCSSFECYISSGKCVTCSKAKVMRWREKNKDKANAATIRCHKENKEQYNSYQRELRKRNKEYNSLRDKEKYKKNPELKIQRASIWRKKNPEKTCSFSAKRRAKKLNATPAWADHNLILKIYEEARRLTEATGVAHEVDHVVPLQGDNVCGLHVHTNLQILTAAENRSKGNRL